MYWCDADDHDADDRDADDRDADDYDADDHDADDHDADDRDAGVINRIRLKNFKNNNKKWKINFSKH